MEKTTSIELLRPSEAAKILSVSTRTLDRWRRDGVGPRWFQEGRIVLYPKKEIGTWIASRTGL